MQTKLANSNVFVRKTINSRVYEKIAPIYGGWRALKKKVERDLMECCSVNNILIEFYSSKNFAVTFNQRERCKIEYFLFIARFKFASFFGEGGKGEEERFSTCDNAIFIVRIYYHYFFFRIYINWGERKKISNVECRNWKMKWFIVGEISHVTMMKEERIWSTICTEFNF